VLLTTAASADTVCVNAHVSPNYAAVVESYMKAQEVAKQSR
jgi:hypothetical protein